MYQKVTNHFWLSKRYPLETIDVMQLNIPGLKSYFWNLFWTLFYHPDHCGEARSINFLISIFFFIWLTWNLVPADDWCWYELAWTVSLHMICHKIDTWTIFPPIYACHSKYETSNCLWLWLYEYILGSASLYPNEPQSCYSRGLHDHGLQDSGKIRWPQGHPDPDGLLLHQVRTNLALRLNFVQEYVEIVASLNSLKKNNHNQFQE